MAGKAARARVGGSVNPPFNRPTWSPFLGHETDEYQAAQRDLRAAARALEPRSPGALAMLYELADSEVADAFDFGMDLLTYWATREWEPIPRPQREFYGEATPTEPWFRNAVGDEESARGLQDRAIEHSRRCLRRHRAVAGTPGETPQPAGRPARVTLSTAERRVLLAVFHAGVALSRNRLATVTRMRKDTVSAAIEGLCEMDLAVVTPRGLSLTGEGELRAKSMVP